MAVHACLKNEFTEAEKCHNLMSWLICHIQRYKWHFNIVNLPGKLENLCRINGHRETWAESLNQAKKKHRETWADLWNRARTSSRNLSRIIESSSEFIAKTWAELLNRSYRSHQETWAESLSHRENLTIFIESNSEVIAKTWAEILYRAQKSSGKLEQNYCIELRSHRENLSRIIQSGSLSPREQT